MASRHRAIFPGSFDPLTSGHIDLVTRALQIFDSVTVGVLANPEKNSLFTVDQRVKLISEVFGDQEKSVVVKSFSGLLVDFARDEGVSVILRGLRAISDYDYETQMALMNKSLSEDVETFFLVSREKYSYVSSSLVKQVARHGGDVTNLVHPVIAGALLQKFS